MFSRSHNTFQPWPVTPKISEKNWTGVPPPASQSLCDWRYFIHTQFLLWYYRGPFWRHFEWYWIWRQTKFTLCNKRECERSKSCQWLADTPSAGCPRSGVFLIIWRLLGDWMVPEMSTTEILRLADWQASRCAGLRACPRTCSNRCVHAGVSMGMLLSVRTRRRAGVNFGKYGYVWDVFHGYAPLLSL